MLSNPLFRFKNPEIQHHNPENLTFKVTERSKALYEQGDNGQGYVGFLDLETGEIDVIPTYNAQDGRERKPHLYQNIDYTAVSIDPRGTRGGTAHRAGLALISKDDVSKGQKASAGKLLAFGFFKGVGTEEKPAPFIKEFMNRSASININAFEYNPYYLSIASIQNQNDDNLVRSIPGQMTNKIIDALLTQLPINSKTQTPDIVLNVRNIKYENEFQKSIRDFNQDKNSQENNYERLIIAAYLGKANLVDNILQSLARQGNQDQNPLIVMAAKFGPPGTLKSLLEKGANPNQIDQDNYTPLIVAARHDSMETVKLLLKCGADPNLAASKSKSALMSAVERKSPEIVKLLLDNNATILDSAVISPLIKAVENNDLETIKILLETETYRNMSSLSTEPSFIKACEAGHIDIVNLFLNKITDMNLPMISSGLSKACQNGNIAIVKLLLDKGANQNEVDKSAFRFATTPLINAINYEQHDIVALLLGHEKNKPDFGNPKNTPQNIFNAASKTGDVKILNLLFKHIPYTQKILTNALEKAFETQHLGNIAAIKLLIEKGADINKIEDEECRTMLLTKLGQCDRIVANVNAIIPNNATEPRTEAINELKNEVKNAMEKMHNVIDITDTVISKLEERIKQLKELDQITTRIKSIAQAQGTNVANVMTQTMLNALNNQTDMLYLDFAHNKKYNHQENIHQLLTHMNHFKQMLAGTSSSKNTASSALSLFKRKPPVLTQEEKISKAIDDATSEIIKTYQSK